MAFFSTSSVKLNGICAAIPKTSVSNSDLKEYDKKELEKLITTLGIEKRRISSVEQCASDLCITAANKLIDELNWNKSDIEVIFFVTQTPDFFLPGSSMHIQERMGLPKSCITFDINQGCAGYVYGLSLISSFISASGIKKGLLLVGDTITKIISPFDRSLIPIFSDCGTATALSFDTAAGKFNFNISSEGKDYDAIIVPHGGAKHPLQKDSLEYSDYEGNIKRKGTHLVMKGLDVFNFSLKKVVPNVEELMSKANQSHNEIDYFVFHQANKLILESISKKMNLHVDKVPSSLKNYGNTSGASIPLTIVSNLKNKNNAINAKILLAGFGVGLSLASAIVDFNNVVCPEIIEL